MNWTRAELGNQFRRAEALGWIDAFKHEAERIGVEPELLLAIASRETNVRNILGDFDVITRMPHGHGIMQIDNRSYPFWCQTGKWKIAAEGIKQGATVLSTKMDQARDKGIPSADLIRVAVASYNVGRKAIDDYYRGNCDARTTGGDYSKDVLARAAVFRGLLK